MRSFKMLSRHCQFHSSINSFPQKCTHITGGIAHNSPTIAQLFVNVYNLTCLSIDFIWITARYAVHASHVLVVLSMTAYLIKLLYLAFKINRYNLILERILLSLVWMRTTTNLVEWDLFVYEMPHQILIKSRIDDDTFIIVNHNRVGGAVALCFS